MIFSLYLFKYVKFYFLYTASGARFTPPISNSRVAIRQMLGQRQAGPPIMTGHPSNPAFTTMPTGGMPGMARQAPMMR